MFWIFCSQRNKVDFTYNKLADPKFSFYDKTLVDAVKKGDHWVCLFFLSLSLCHTVMSEEKVEGEEGAQASWTGNVWQSLGGLRMDVFVRIGNGWIFNSWWTVRISSEIAVTADALKQKTALTLNADPVIGPMWCSGKSSWSWDSVMCCQSPLKLSLRSGPLSDKTSWRKRWVVLLALHYLKVPPHIHPGFFSNLKKMWHLRVWKSTEKLCHPSSHQIFFKNKDWGAVNWLSDNWLSA